MEKYNVLILTNDRPKSSDSNFVIITVEFRFAGDFLPEEYRIKREEEVYKYRKQQ